jgi:hypothetical protein
LGPYSSEKPASAANDTPFIQALLIVENLLKQTVPTTDRIDARFSKGVSTKRFAADGEFPFDDTRRKNSGKHPDQ